MALSFGAKVRPIWRISLARKVEGKKVDVEFREPENEEIMLCTTAGPGYGQIYITEAK